MVPAPALLTERVALVLKLALAAFLVRSAVATVYEAHLGASVHDQIKHTRNAAIRCSALWAGLAVYHVVCFAPVDGAFDGVFAFVAWLFARLLAYDLAADRRLALFCTVVKQHRSCGQDSATSPRAMMVLFATFLLVGASVLCTRCIWGYLILGSPTSDEPSRPEKLRARVPLPFDTPQAEKSGLHDAR